MGVAARELARFVLGQLPIERNTIPIDGTDIDAAAVCLGHGNGAFRLGDSGTIVLILCDITACNNDRCPHIVLAALTTVWQEAEPKTTRAFASGRCERLTNLVGSDCSFYPRGYRYTWLPVLANQTDSIPFGGPIGIKPIASSVSPNSDKAIDWYDLSALDAFPNGCLLWRSRGGRLSAHQRVQSDLWVTIATIPRPRPIMNILAIIRRLGTPYAIEPVPGLRPLVFTT